MRNNTYFLNRMPFSFSYLKLDGSFVQDMVKVSDQAQQQAAALQQTNSTMQEITSGLSEVDNEIKLAQDVVVRTALNAEQVKDAMGRSIDAMDNVQPNHDGRWHAGH